MKCATRITFNWKIKFQKSKEHKFVLIPLKIPIFFENLDCNKT